MRHWLRFGVSLALGLCATPTWGQDIEWRSSTPAGNTPAASEPAATASPAPKRFITLGRPVANNADNVPSLVRAKNDDESRPLPQGPSLKGDTKIDDIQFQPSRPQLIQTPGAQPKGGNSETAPMPRPMPMTVPGHGPGHVTGPMIYDEGEVIPTKPRFFHHHRPYRTYSTPMTDACDCGTPTILADPCVVDGGACCGDVCGSCAPCCDPCCDPCGDCFAGCCYPRGKYWVRGEYLAWGFKNPRTPALVTQGLAPNNFGSLGQFGTTILYGGDQFDNPVHSGGRLTAGFWFHHHDEWGLEASVFGLGSRTSNFTASSSGNTVLGRPLIDAFSGQETVEPVAFPGLLSGSVSVDYRSRLYGAELNLRKKWHCGPNYHFDLLAGYRYLQLQEDITISENLRTVPDNVGIIVNDHWGTRNSFNGGQIGFDGEYRFWHRMFVAGQFKIGFGNVHQTINIDGTTTFISPSGNQQVVFPSGVLATTTNSGRFERDRFCVVPEANLKIGVDITERLRVFVGYNFLYMSSVTRPGDAIDRTINTTQLPSVLLINGQLVPIQGNLVGPARPAVFFKGSDFWAQGLNAGLEYRW